MKFKNLTLLLTLVAILTGCHWGDKQSKDKTNSPNIVFILVDDLGWKDTGYMGSKYYETPNVDKLASKSLVFTHAYAGAANCAPSRAALMSGMDATKTGIYTVGSSERGKAQTRKLIPIPNKEFLEDSVYTMAEMLKDAGYVTGIFGKWHLGEDPCTQGFDYNVGGGRAGHPKSYFAPYGTPNIPAPEGEYLTDRLANEAVRFIENNKDHKFFLYLPFYAVHSPYRGKEAIVRKYEQKKGSNGQDNPTYAAMVEVMDYNVGKVLNKLDELGLSKNTLVVFTSDNGGVDPVSNQAPLRSGKGSYFEGGVRVPLAIRWPGKIQHSTTDAPVINLDFYPTFMELVHGSNPHAEQLDGVSLYNFLTKGEKLPERSFVFHFPIYLEAYKKGDVETFDPLFRTRPGTTIEKDEWKLHYYYENKDTLLYNLKTDIGEENNLLKEMPEKKEELMHMMEQWMNKNNAPIPTQLNPEYDTHLEK